MKLVSKGLDNQEVRAKTKHSVGVVDVSFEVYEGETLVPMGLSGNGKSTLIRCINRLIARTSGRVIVDETDVTALDENELLSLETKVKKTIVFITHNPDEALKMGDRFVLMKDGRVVQIGSPDEILTKPANDYVQKFLENVDYTKVLTAGDVLVTPKTVTAMKDGPATVLRAMKTAGLPGIFVVGQDRALQGCLTLERATEASQHGQAHFEELLERIDVPTVNPDTPLRDIFQHVAHNTHPVAVVDGDGKPKGVVHQSSIIVALAERGEHYAS